MLSLNVFANFIVKLNCFNVCQFPISIVSLISTRPFQLNYFEISNMIYPLTCISQCHITHYSVSSTSSLGGYVGATYSNLSQTLSLIDSDLFHFQIWKEPVFALLRQITENSWIDIIVSSGQYQLIPAWNLDLRGKYFAFWNNLKAHPFQAKCGEGIIWFCN